MNFGQYLKLQRSELNWTQPEAAQKIGIEQSYLSKLETGKSIPSDEIFTKVQEAYQFDVNEMADLIESNDLLNLIEIAEVKKTVQAIERKKITMTRSWLIAGLLSLMLAGGFIGAAIVPEIESTEYSYRSNAVLNSGEDINTFSDDKIDPSRSELSPEQRQSLIERIDQKYLTLKTTRGNSFIVKDRDGIRHYKLLMIKNVKQSRFPRWLIAPGLMLLFGGFGSFYLARAWQAKK